MNSNLAFKDVESISNRTARTASCAVVLARRNARRATSAQAVHAVGAAHAESAGRPAAALEAQP